MTSEAPSHFCLRPYNMALFSVVAHMDVFWLIPMLEKFSCIMPMSLWHFMIFIVFLMENISINALE